MTITTTYQMIVRKKMLLKIYTKRIEKRQRVYILQEKTKQTKFLDRTHEVECSFEINTKIVEYINPYSVILAIV